MDAPHPYREPPSAPTPGEADARRASCRALPALGLIALAFFLPTVRSCNRMESGLSYSSEGPLRALLVAPVFAAAAVLALATLAALARGAAPGARSRAAAFVALAAAFAANALYVVTLIAKLPGRWDPAMLVPLTPALVAIVPTVALSLRGLRGRAWVAWGDLLVGYAAAACGSFDAFMIGMAVLSGPRRDVGPGAYVFTAGLVALLAVVGRALVPRGVRTIRAARWS